MVDECPVERMIPRTMSTQHPDNANIPEWWRADVLEGEAEIYETYFTYRNLDCNEVMWDSEGKDVDIHVIRKLLSKKTKIGLTPSNPEASNKSHWQFCKSCGVSDAV